MITRRRSTVAIAAILLCIASPSAPLRAQINAEEVDRVTSLIALSKFSAVRATNAKQAVWTITKRGPNRGDFKVVVTVKNGQLIIFVTVEKKANVRRTAELDQKLLKMNYDYDYVKVGYDDDEDVYVRIDSLLRTVDWKQFNEVVDQVGNTTELVYALLKPYLLR